MSNTEIQLPTTITRDQRDAAMDWILDCQWAEDRDELVWDLHDMSDDVLVYNLSRHYAGGWTQFLEDSLLG